jgi:PEP-CTERM motif
MARLAQITCTATLILVAATISVRADPIHIVSGSVFIPTVEHNGAATLVGTPSFTFAGQAGLPNSFFGMFGQCAVPECPPGTIININLDLSGQSGSLGGTMTVGGNEYGVSDNINANSDLFLHFDGSFIAPAMGPPVATVSVPFSLTGQAHAINSLGETVLDDQIFGHGIATVSLLPYNPQAGFDPSWTVDTARFDFLQPTPEPSTLLLIGAGTLVPMIRRRRRS